jgi:hypothetical protein
MSLHRVKLAALICQQVALGHNSNLLQTRRAARDQRRRRRLAASRPAERNEPFAAKLRQQGYLRLDPGYPDELIAKLQEGAAFADQPGASVAMGGRIKESVRYIVDPLGKVPALRELLTPEVAATVRAWFGSEFRIDSVRMWRIAHVPPEEQNRYHYGNLWHVDGHTLDTLKMFVQISADAAATGSAFRLLSRADTRRAFRRGYLDPHHVLGAARRLVDENAIYFDGPPGEVMFVDTDICLHRAGIPAVGQRRAMVQLIFKPADQPPADGDYFAQIPIDPNVYEGAIA